MLAAPLDCGRLPAAGSFSCFKSASGVDEYHLMLTPTTYGDFESQLSLLEHAYHKALGSQGLSPDTAIFRRFFCSDLTNQAGLLRQYAFSSPGGGGDPESPCAVSWVRQPPCPPARVGLWAYHVSDPAGPPVKHWDPEGRTLTWKRGEFSHCWTTGLDCCEAADSYEQTREILRSYAGMLRERGMTLADSALRTWIYVQHIDADYPGMVKARRAFFTEHGLTPSTHFIASTGIEGAGEDLRARVLLEAYAVGGVLPQQIRYLSAPDHLSPTSLYGVTFERGTCVGWRDRRHVYLSGTASIDSQGQIVHPGDITRQLDRTVENLEALLEEAGGRLSDVASFVAYVRDPSDQRMIRQLLRERFGAVPLIVLLAPVCRPGWLVEVEAMATLPASAPELPEF